VLVGTPVSAAASPGTSVPLSQLSKAQFSVAVPAGTVKMGEEYCSVLMPKVP
jgi:hypothetical protein